MPHSPVPMERRRRPLAVACGLLSAAVLAVGVAPRAPAAPAPEPNKEEPKKEEPKADRPAAGFPALPDFDEMLKRLPADLPPEQLQMLRDNIERMKKMMEQQRQNGRPGFSFPNVPFGPGLPGAEPRNARLGVMVEKPDETLAEQLELPKDQGLVIHEVMADSAAAKAGLKAHDILLELDGKAVSSDPEEFRRMVGEIKADAPVDAVVLRKGKKETIKGLTLPEAKTSPPLPAPPFTPPGAAPPVAPAAGIDFGAGAGVTTTTARTNDQFTTRHQEGDLIIALTGQVKDGKAVVHEITVRDGGESKTYDGVDKVPEKYRDKVKGLVEMSGKGSVKVEIKTP